MYEKSHLLLFKSNWKKKKLKNLKEIEVIINEEAVKEVKIIVEIENLIERINKFKIIKIEKPNI